MSSHVSIRESRESDAAILIQFNMAMALETEGKQLDCEAVSAGVRKVLADPARGFYLVAESADDIVGSLMVTTEWSDWRNGFYWWIQSVYVRPEWRRRGIYRKLYALVTSRASLAGDVCGVRLYVDGDNTAARDVYRRLGMAETSYLVFEETFRENPNHTE